MDDPARQTAKPCALVASEARKPVVVYRRTATPFDSGRSGGDDPTMLTIGRGGKRSEQSPNRPLRRSEGAREAKPTHSRTRMNAGILERMAKRRDRGTPRDAGLEDQDGAHQNGQSSRSASTPGDTVPPSHETVVAAEVIPLPKGDSNVARARRQASKPAGHQETTEGDVVEAVPRSLVIPEGKRCQALTARGTRCKAPKLRGLRVCMFHGHLATDDERLLALADPDPLAKPRLSPRKALKAVAELRAGEMAVRAVEGALTASARDGGRAVLGILDAVDPLTEERRTLDLTPDGVATLSLSEIRSILST